ncbi:MULTISPECIES: hypothetical protein [Okeania]|nr:MULTISPECIES: hypothetical protein [Okeania]
MVTTNFAVLCRKEKGLFRVAIRDMGENAIVVNNRRWQSKELMKK